MSGSRTNKAPTLSRHVVWTTDEPAGEVVLASWRPDDGPTLHRVDRKLADALSLIDGVRTIDDIAFEVGGDPLDILEHLQSMEISMPDMFEWEGAGSRRMVAAAARLRAAWTATQAQASRNTAFHGGGIEDADRQFDDVETTVSHLFREPHPALGGRSYGDAVCDLLLTSGALSPNCRVLEVGGGVGFFADALLSRLRTKAPAVYASVEYTIFDLSPELQRSQRATCASHDGRVRYQLGDIERPNLTLAAFDLVISNEMIADLSVARVRPDRVALGTPDTPAEEIAARYGLECASPFAGGTGDVAINTGAIHFLETVDQLLAEGGTAFITEYGYEDRLPEAVPFGDHDEYTIHFGHLRQAAEHLELAPLVENLGELLEFDPEYRLLDLRCHRSLSRALLPALGDVALPTIAYDNERLAELVPGIERVHGLVFRPLAKAESLTPFRFFALRLSKQGAAEH